MLLRDALLLCLVAVMLGSCAGRRARNAMPSKCVAGQGDETTCNQPASCTCS